MRNITIAYGDGIGPDIMESVLQILQACKVDLNFTTIEVGENIYKKGFNSGLMPSAWQELENSRILLKAPITTPQGGGYKSLNVTLRKKLGLYANIRPVSSFYPYVATNFPKMDLVIVRENEEDLYTGIEHRHSFESYQCLKIATRKSSEKIMRFAFEYAVKNKRNKVSCFSKDNIMKRTDGIFHKVFDEVAKEYPNIKNDHHIIDIATARVAARPEMFDVIVTTNLYGDIVSDVAAEISGSVGLAGSANIGDNHAMFEAIHGSAPDIAGQDIANPSGLIQACVMMLNHIGHNKDAAKIRNALYKTIEDGVHTGDIYKEELSKRKVGTKDFTKALIDNLGAKPQKFVAADFGEDNISQDNKKTKNIDNFFQPKIINKTLIGIDLFLDYQDDFKSLLESLKGLESEIFEVKTISSKGLLLWPLIDEHMMPSDINGLIVMRLVAKGVCGKSSNQILDAAKSVSKQEILDIMQYFAKNNLDFVKYEGLYHFDGEAGYSAAQGE